MKNYTIMAIDWDYGCQDQIEEYQRKGIYLPSMISEVMEHCGSLYPYITNETSAIKHIKSIKREFPFVHFGLYEGRTWGELELVKEF